jgi:RNA polymerase sigma-70 factor (ECF subfamily)
MRLVNDKNEQEMLLALRRGERSAWRRFYRGTQQKLLWWVKVRVKETADAEEIVQDSYLALLESLPLYRGGSSLWTFLVAIAKHEVMDYWRKKYAKKAILTIPFADYVYTEKLYSSAQTAAVIEMVYQKLKAREVQILRWKYEEGLPMEAIAKRLKVSVKAAESRLFRARRTFQVAYQLATSD